MLLVLGCHRSGTSALTRALNLQSATLPKSLMKPQADNPEGFWESKSIVQLNEAFLKTADRSWHDPRPIDLGWFKEPGKRLNRIEQAKKLIAQEFPKGDLLVLKDPRICRLLPIWLTALEQSNIDASALLISRNPLEVAASLDARNQINRNQSNLLWLEHTLPAEKQTRHLPRAFVGFDDLLEDWRSVLTNSFEDLGIESIDLTSNSADEIDQFLARDKKNCHANTDQLLKDESISPLLKSSWVAFQTRPIPSVMVFDALQEEYFNLTKNLIYPKISQGVNNSLSTEQSKVETTTNPSIALKEGSPRVEDHRHIILHYHLFKNAGTSLDKTLKENFKEGWHEHEGPSSGWKSSDVATYLQENKQIQVLSSHTALFPVPELPNTTIHPVIFVRHPIDRIRSIYEFEHKQLAETEGAIKAKELDLVGYIKWRLSRKGDRTIRNFHSLRFSLASKKLEGEIKYSELERALKSIDNLPFVGIVESFDESIQKCEIWLHKFFPNVSLKSIMLNVTQAKNSSLSERLSNFQAIIGDDLYGQLIEANELDLKLYDHAVAKANLHKE
jgi:hypothetical protein